MGEEEEGGMRKGWKKREGGRRGCEGVIERQREETGGKVWKEWKKRAK